MQVSKAGQAYAPEASFASKTLQSPAIIATFHFIFIDNLITLAVAYAKI